MLSARQEEILKLVKNNGAITAEEISHHFGLTRAAIRNDLSLLTMLGFLQAKPRVGYVFNLEQRDDKYSLSLVRVRDCQSSPVIVSGSTSVYDAIVKIFKDDVGTLYIADSEKILKGVVSRKDLLKQAIGGGSLHDIPVSIIMTRYPNIVTVSPDESIVSAAKKLIDREVDSLPVVEEVTLANGEKQLKILGRFTKTNVVRVFTRIEG